VQVSLAASATDARKGFDGLAALMIFAPNDLAGTDHVAVRGGS
jgi:hypothetical protein